jgi:hypothetical protein
MSKRFWLQTLAPAGNWVDSIGSDDFSSVCDHGRWLVEKMNHQHTRVVERVDTPKWEMTRKEKQT